MLDVFDSPPAVVIGATWANGLGLLRSLGQAGVPVLVLDPNPGAIGRFSRHAIVALVCPDAGEQEAEFLDFMDLLGERLSHPGVLFLTRDQDVSTVSRNQSRLERHFLVPFARWEVLSGIVDKQGQYAVAQEAGLPLPITRFPRSEEDAAVCAKSVPYPAILKPAYHVKFSERFGVKGFVANDAQEALAYYRRGEAQGYQMMIQEIIPGEEHRLYTYGSYRNRDLIPLAEFTGRKLRQHPRVFGTCRLGESCAAPEMAELGRRMLQALEFWGVSQVEFKQDPRDNLYKLMEVNARNWQWQHLSTVCGANLAHAAYRDALGQPLAPVQAAADGKRWSLAATELFVSPRELLNGQLSLRDWFSGWRGVTVDGIFSWHDPSPGWHYVYGHIVRRLRGLP
jgi:predicted ATP-grasp superfamily ATP-dependent carboligase